MVCQVGRVRLVGKRMPDYRTTYRTQDGHIRVPFADLGIFLRIERVPISVSEARAIENVATFLFSAGILTKRLKAHVDAYKEDTWVAVPIHELFLDTQGFFLFVQQLLEDLALIIRMSLPPAQRHQMSPAFSKMTQRLLKDVLPPDAPFARFLSTEGPWLSELKDLRDDILHRTVFRERSATFPDLIDVLRAGGGQPHFRGTNLAKYLGGVVVRVFGLNGIASNLNPRKQLRRRGPQDLNRPPSRQDAGRAWRVTVCHSCETGRSYPDLYREFAAPSGWFVAIGTRDRRIGSTNEPRVEVEQVNVITRLDSHGPQCIRLWSPHQLPRQTLRFCRLITKEQKGAPFSHGDFLGSRVSPPQPSIRRSGRDVCHAGVQEAYNKRSWRIRSPGHESPLSLAPIEANLKKPIRSGEVAEMEPTTAKVQPSNFLPMCRTGQRTTPCIPQGHNRCP